MLPVLSEEVVRHRIARRIAMEFEDGDVVNLGIGIPTLVSDHIPEGVRVIFQTENGVVGAGPKPPEDDLRFIGAGGRCLSVIPGGALIASDFSFGLIRGGHLDATVLGALQVDQEGNLANWWIPGKLVPGMGGAMDLVTGAKHVIVATTHTTKKGQPKLVKKCSLPLTGAKVVSLVVTEYALFRFVDGQMVLEEIAPGVTEEDLKGVTEAEYVTSSNLSIMKGCDEEQN
ncbi:3-oxoacid CoA-transferase subunit B [Thermovirga sp.]|uniref:3-oxoacid CoA-transferase subunit B n=1 Tax=Thermovirga sp. TaxID=2699834 RepID=UPI0025CC6FB7|nr:3-oxoacid CoA-transferase subunit B [Thermovirga sp.]MBO8154440.1 3-oxoacid CoA-transferase subunit B [Thermovirga sp.]MCD6183729.1 3-oxoacid CoA-transferase subunit B [Thermovirga sp.]